MLHSFFRYNLTIDVESEDYTVSGSPVVASGSLAAGFAMTLNNGDGATLFLENDIPVAITWSVARGISKNPDNRDIEKQTIACCAEYKSALINVKTTFK